MDSSPFALLTTLKPAPPGFTPVDLRKRHLLSGPVAVLVPDLSAVQDVFADYAARMQGLIITAGSSTRLDQISPMLWHIRMDAAQVALAATMVPGWLSAIAVADQATQKLYALETKVERVERQLQLTRHDYNDLTTRLLAQVQDLTTAKGALGELNRSLESRVQQRTGDLALANSTLSTTLDVLRSTQKELVRTAQLAGLGSLVAGIAHELNTPIGTALTASTALAHAARTMQALHAGGQLGRKALEQFLLNSQDIADLLERNLTRAAERIGQFRQIAVTGDGGDRHRFKLADVVSGALSYLAPKVSDTPYRMDQAVDPGIEMESYPGAIHQVLTNLVNNALAHGFEGRDSGTMTLRAELQSPSVLTLTFSDDGRGIPGAQLSHIFEPFFTTKFGQGGSGLGLYIVYAQVRDLLGGQLDVQSTEGHGTRFVLTLPLQAPPQQAAQ